MIYPDNFEQKTGFDQLRQMIHNYCISSLGRHYVQKMGFSTHFATIEKWLDQTHEFRQILLSGQPFPVSGYFDLFAIFDRLHLEGTFAEAEELGDLRASLQTIDEVLRFLQSRKSDDQLLYPVLNQLTHDIYLDREIVKELNRLLDEKSHIRSNASPRLSEIISSKTRLEVQAAGKINQLLSTAKKQGWVATDAELVLRNGRQVMPVPAAYKRKIKGFVHDQSATGQTVFLEPEEVFEIHNEIRQLELDQRREIVKILKEFADFLRPWLPDLKKAYAFLGTIDFIRAKARLAIEMEALKPRLQKEPGINWIKARHPLLFLSYKPQKKHVEPLNIQLTPDNSIIVISGPNAGGKSVCLKTTGLIQYMLQCGLLAPMEDYSEVGIFQKIFIDIGDQQSLENDLSTYSSHLYNMRHFLAHCQEHSLFLIDEFGAGTEPRLGGAIAEAILTDLSQKKAFGVITTHYANLKILAGKTTGILNGSMLFDTQHMRPLYRLKTGNPGSSFAFEIAKTMGLPAEILHNAEKIAGAEHIDFDRQLQDLELKKLQLEEKEKQLQSGDAFLSEMIDKYQKLENELEQQKKQIIQQARLEAKQILANTNKTIEKTIREIRESGAEKEKTKMLRQELESFASQHRHVEETTEGHASKSQKKKKKQTPKPDVLENSPITVGDTVCMKDGQTPGEVMQVDAKDAVVAFGGIKIKTPLKKLQKIRKAPGGKTPQKARVKYDFDINEKASAFNPQIDIRGQKAEEALVKARRFVDDAILLGIKQLKVVHGTGEGILREALRDYLRTLSEVKRARDEHPDRGGAGCTLIELK